MRKLILRWPMVLPLVFTVIADPPYPGDCFEAGAAGAGGNFRASAFRAFFRLF